MSNNVMTREFVLEVLKDGVESLDPSKGTTASRVIRIKNHMARGTPLGEVAKKVGLGLDRAKEVQGWIEEFNKLYPKLVGEKHVHRPNRVPEALVGFVRQIGEKMWVPEPDEMPLDFIGPGSGFRSLPVGAGHLTWQQENGIPVRCWVTDDEDERLREIFRLLEEADQGNQIGDRYDRLQNAVVDYINKTRRYLWGAYMNGDFVPIPKLKAAILGGEVVDVSRDQFSTSYELMDELPRVRGQVEEFRRDLEIAVAGLGARAVS